MLPEPEHRNPDTSPDQDDESAAARAIREAEARRRSTVQTPSPPERAGRGGLEPVRYGDWEIGGIAKDF